MAKTIEMIALIGGQEFPAGKCSPAQARILVKKELASWRDGKLIMLVRQAHADLLDSNEHVWKGPLDDNNVSGAEMDRRQAWFRALLPKVNKTLALVGESVIAKISESARELWEGRSLQKHRNSSWDIGGEAKTRLHAILRERGGAVTEEEYLEIVRDIEEELALPQDDKLGDDPLPLGEWDDVPEVPKGFWGPTSLPCKQVLGLPDPPPCEFTAEQVEEGFFKPYVKPSFGLFPDLEDPADAKVVHKGFGTPSGPVRLVAARKDGEESIEASTELKAILGDLKEEHEYLREEFPDLKLREFPGATEGDPEEIQEALRGIQEEISEE